MLGGTSVFRVSWVVPWRCLNFALYQGPLVALNAQGMGCGGKAQLWDEIGLNFANLSGFGLTGRAAEHRVPFTPTGFPRPPSQGKHELSTKVFAAATLCPCFRGEQRGWHL